MSKKTKSTTARATAGTTNAENSAPSTSAAQTMDNTDIVMDGHVPAAQEDPVAGDDDPQAATPANMDKYSKVLTDNFHDSHGRATCCLKGGTAALSASAAEVRQFQVALGDRFYDFARVRLGLAPSLADFLLRVAEMGLDPARFSPAIEVKMAAVMEMMARIVDAWAAVTSSAMPAAICEANVASPVETDKLLRENLSVPSGHPAGRQEHA